MSAEPTKACSLCGERKGVSGFYKASAATDGLQARCKQCHADRVRDYRRRLKQQNEGHEVPRDYMKRCPRCETVKSAGEFHRNVASRDGLHWVCRGCNARRGRYGKQVEQERRFRRYNITREEVDALLHYQEYRCAICRCIFTGTEFHIDHCHTSAAVRGLLCGRCNTALGLFGDSGHRLRMAATYLRRPPMETLRGT